MITNVQSNPSITAPFVSGLAALANWFAPMPTAAESSEQLQDLADTYESTQPSYAADLRAAAAATRH